MPKMFLILALALSACAIVPKAKTCGEAVVSDAAIELLPTVRRILADLSYENAKKELAVLVFDKGIDFVRCMVEQVKADSAGTFAADPSSTTRTLNADRWLKEAK